MVVVKSDHVMPLTIFASITKKTNPLIVDSQRVAALLQVRIQPFASRCSQMKNQIAAGLRGSVGWAGGVGVWGAVVGDAFYARVVFQMASRNLRLCLS